MAATPTGADREVDGAAHELMNLLSVVKNYTGLVQRELEDPTLAGFLDEVQVAVDKATDVAQRLQAIGRRDG